MKYKLTYKGYELPTKITNKKVIYAVLRELTGKTTKELRNDISRSRNGEELDYTVLKQTLVKLIPLTYEYKKYI